MRTRISWALLDVVGGFKSASRHCPLTNNLQSGHRRRSMADSCTGWILTAAFPSPWYSDHSNGKAISAEFYGKKPAVALIVKER